MPCYRVLQRHISKPLGLCKRQAFPYASLSGSLQSLHFCQALEYTCSTSYFESFSPCLFRGSPTHSQEGRSGNIPLGTLCLISATLLPNRTHTDQGEPGSRLIKGRSAGPGKIPPMSQPSQESSACMTAVNWLTKVWLNSVTIYTYRKFYKNNMDEKS